MQVEGIPTVDDLARLEKGIILGGKVTLQANSKIINEFLIEPRNPPIRYRKNIPETWISVTLIEGRNRQVRKMTAAIGYPTLRLIRIRIKNLMLGDLKPGEVRELTKADIDLLTF